MYNVAFLQYQKPRNISKDCLGIVYPYNVNSKEVRKNEIDMY